MEMTNNTKAFAASGILSSIFGAVAPLGADRIAKAFVDNFMATGAVQLSVLVTAGVGLVSFTLANIWAVSAVNERYKAFKAAAYGGVTGFAAGMALSLSVSSTDSNNIDVSALQTVKATPLFKVFRRLLKYPFRLPDKY